jgi:putative membrane protein
MNEGEPMKKIHPLTSSSEKTAGLSARDRFAADRTSLANERTLLAYIRTAIALLATGVGLPYLFTSTFTIVVGAILIALSVFLIIMGVWRFRAERRRIQLFM